MSLTGKCALVTGASRGIGRAIAFTLAKQGATVAGTATSQASADKLTEAFKEEGLTGQGFVMDVTQSETIKSALTEIEALFGPPAILINNAGITRDNLMLRMKIDEWDEVIKTNLNGAFQVTKACLKGMIKARWGRIISIASVVGLSGNPGQANYCASKAGLIGFSKSLALEIAKRNITVNVVAPGLIETDMINALSEEQQEKILNAVPIKRYGSPNEVADAVAFLASPNAGYITGETLNINGGMYLA